MHIVLGADGHVGSATAKALLAMHQPVTVVLHKPDATADWQAHGATVAVADLRDSGALRRILEPGARLFLLNPPAPPSTDASLEEHRTVDAILDAARDVPLDRIVAESTYGAQPGQRLGDLGVLHAMEQRLREFDVPVSVIRGAYYMTNWDASLDAVRATGHLPSFFPADFELPMVSPLDIGAFAATLLAGPFAGFGPHPVEGPARYTPADVAETFAAVLHRDVTVDTTPPDRWLDALAAMGFSKPAAESFAAMTAATLAQGAERPDAPQRGQVTLFDHLAALVSTG